MRRRVLWSSFLIPVLMLSAGFAWLCYTEAGLRWTERQLRARLPGTLTITSLQGRLAGPLAVRGLRYHNETVGIELDRANVEWSPLRLLVGRLQIDALALDRLRVHLAGAKEPAKAPGRWSLPLSVRLTNARLHDLEVRRDGRVLTALQSIELTGSANSRRVHLRRFHAQASNVELTAEGTLGFARSSERLSMQWRFQLPNGRVLAGSGDVSGNLAELSIEQQLAEPLAATVRARVLDALSDPRWQAQVQIPDFTWRTLSKTAPVGRSTIAFTVNGDRRSFEANGTLSAKLAGWPQTEGSFGARGATDGLLQLDSFTLRIPGTTALVSGNARWQLGRNTGAAELRWRDLRWPLAGTPMLRSADGKLTITGDATDYRLALDAELGGANLPPGRWHASGRGNRLHVAFDSITAHVLGGTLKGNSRIAWSPRLQWSARVQGAALNPGTIWHEWPGSLELRAQLSGSARGLRVEIPGVSGTLRGRALSAEGRLVQQGAHYPELAFAIRTSGASATLTGSKTAQWNIGWSVNARELGALLPNASGQLAGKGTFTGLGATPRVQALISGSNLTYGENHAQALRVDLALDLSDRTRSRIRGSASKIRFAGREIENTTLNADGLTTNHTVSVEADAPDVRLTAHATGRYGDAAWRGVIDRSIVTLGKEAWSLTQPSHLRASAGRVALDETCWHAPPAHVCVQMNHATAAATTLGLKIERLSLHLLAPVLPPALTLRGTTSGIADGRLEHGQWVQARAQLRLSPGSVTLAAPSSTMLRYQRVAVDLNLDATALRAHADFALPGGDGGNADIAIPRAGRRNADAMTGKLTLRVRDLTPFAALFPQLSELRGALHADLSLGGTPADPSVRGKVALTGASARVPAYGIAVRDVRLTGTALGNRQIRLNGFARSGGGQLGLSGRIVFPQGNAWHTELRIAGERFRAVNLPEAQVYTSPDLRVHVSPDAIRVTGDVHIPKARFAPRKRRDAVPVSPDVVIVNGAADEPAAPRAPWAVTAEVQVTLGDEVRFEGFGLSAGIEGSVRLIDAPNQVTTARGELSVAQGQYEVYGQKLELERGRLLFIGGPVHNPGIDARAARRVNDVVTGVDVRGTLEAPQLTLYSDPPMGQADMLSYLLFGRPLESNSAQGRAVAAAARALRLSGGERLARWLGARFGVEEVDIETEPVSQQAALVLGKHLSPQLYINYSIGLFESASVFRLRYQLTRHWSLEAQSGTAAGGDILYSIER